MINESGTTYLQLAEEPSYLYPIKTVAAEQMPSNLIQTNSGFTAYVNSSDTDLPATVSKLSEEPVTFEDVIEKLSKQFQTGTSQAEKDFQKDFLTNSVTSLSPDDRLADEPKDLEPYSLVLERSNASIQQSTATRNLTPLDPEFLKMLNADAVKSNDQTVTGLPYAEDLITGGYGRHGSDYTSVIKENNEEPATLKLLTMDEKKALAEDVLAKMENELKSLSDADRTTLQLPDDWQETWSRKVEEYKQNVSNDTLEKRQAAVSSVEDSWKSLSKPADQLSQPQPDIPAYLTPSLATKAYKNSVVGELKGDQQFKDVQQWYIETSRRVEQTPDLQTQQAMREQLAVKGQQIATSHLRAADRIKEHPELQNLTIFMEQMNVDENSRAKFRQTPYLARAVGEPMQDYFSTGESRRLSSFTPELEEKLAKLKTINQAVLVARDYPEFYTEQKTGRVTNRNLRKFDTSLSDEQVQVFQNFNRQYDDHFNVKNLADSQKTVKINMSTDPNVASSVDLSSKVAGASQIAVEFDLKDTKTIKVNGDPVTSKNAYLREDNKGIVILSNNDVLTVSKDNQMLQMTLKDTTLRVSKDAAWEIKQPEQQQQQPVSRIDRSVDQQIPLSSQIPLTLPSKAM